MGGQRRIGPPPPTYGGRYGTAGAPPPGYGRTPVSTRDYTVNGQTTRANRYGGFRDFSYGWANPAWYFYTPFSPWFYVHPPVLYAGQMYPGGYHYGRIIGGVLLVGLIVGGIVMMRRWSLERD